MNMQTYTPAKDVLVCRTAKDAAQIAGEEFAESNQIGYPPEGHLKNWCVANGRKFKDASIAEAEKKLNQWVDFYRSDTYKNKIKEKTPAQGKWSVSITSLNAPTQSPRMILFDCPACGRRLSRSSNCSSKSCNFCRAKLEFDV